jgi:hypothetical protein
MPRVDRAKLSVWKHPEHCNDTEHQQWEPELGAPGNVGFFLRMAISWAEFDSEWESGKELKRLLHRYLLLMESVKADWMGLFRVRST